MRSESKENQMQKVYEIAGMTCDHCDHHVGTALSGIDGVRSATADFRVGEATVLTDRELTDEEVSAALEEAGYALA